MYLLKVGPGCPTLIPAGKWWESRIDTANRIKDEDEAKRTLASFFTDFRRIFSASLGVNIESQYAWRDYIILVPDGPWGKMFIEMGQAFEMEVRVTDGFHTYNRWGNQVMGALRETELSFADAMNAVEQGYSVYRAGWNGKDMYVLKIQGSNDIAKLHGYGFGELLGEPTFADTYVIRTPDNHLYAWLPSQQDMQKKDWCIYKPDKEAA